MAARRSSLRHEVSHGNISDKANSVLNVILFAILLIIIRIWHLTAIQHEEKVAEARKPRTRTIVEAAKRATIRDRFNLPLAANKACYQATILYSQLAEIPSVVWETGLDGKKIKRFKRREHIRALSELLGQELTMDPERIEDLIHAKASFIQQLPFVIKEEISEEQYYRLKALEKEWPAICARRIFKRHYPLGRVASDIIGYMGAINRTEYDAIIGEIKSLEQYLADSDKGKEEELPKGMSFSWQVRERLAELQEHAYTINDYVGKVGIEGMYEEMLRGFQGKKSYDADARGDFLRELPGTREPLSGQRLLLTISAELQAYAEELLIKNEQIRESKLSSRELGKSLPLPNQPWIKGGAIVAIDPNTGELLALASYPRFDPNDFILSGDPEVNKKKRLNVSRWLENEQHIAAIWDQKVPLKRERFDNELKAIYEEARFLSWQHYLDFILPADSPVMAAMKNIKSLGDVFAFQRNFELQRYPDFLTDLGEHTLAYDLSRLIASADCFSQPLQAAVQSQELSFYRNATAALIPFKESLQQKMKELFHQLVFKEWRKKNEKAFLKEKRKEEKEAKREARPYIDHLDGKEKVLFQEFWSRFCWPLVAFLLSNGDGEEDLSLDAELTPYLEPLRQWKKTISQDNNPLYLCHVTLRKSIAGMPANLALEYLQTMKSFHELTRPLIGHYRHLRSAGGVQLEKHLAAAFYPLYGFGYGRSQAYRQAAIQGSIFKLVTTYEALRQRRQELISKQEPFEKIFEFVDDAHRTAKGWNIGYFSDGTPIPQLYKGGRLPRSRVANLGAMDLLKALELSSNPYFSLLADLLDRPSDLAEAARLFSYGSPTGIDLPGEIAGKVPNDLDYNRTGLYSCAIGQHTLVVTPLQTALMLSAIANGGSIFKPKIVAFTAGRERKSCHEKKEEEKIIAKQYFPYQKSLKLIGIEFPLFTAVDLKMEENSVTAIPSEVKRKLFFPSDMRYFLLHAMQQVVLRNQRESLGSLTRLYRDYPEAIHSYTALKNELIGKTSTSEALEQLNIDSAKKGHLCTHVWFAGITFAPFDKNNSLSSSFVSDPFGKPELVVIVYLRFGSFGKEAAPLAAQIAQKWREIKAKHKVN